MTLHIGKKIKERRKRLNLTQDDLATAVGVSVPAVSKWESGSSYPDITLLVPIARMLDISVDELIDNPGNLPIEEVPKLANQARAFFEAGDYLNGISFSQKLINENPHCLLLQYRLASVLINYLSAMQSDVHTLAVQTAISWLECSMKIQEPIEAKLASYHYLGQLYLILGEFEKAEEVLKKLPDDLGLDYAGSLALLYTMQGEYKKANQFCQEHLYINVAYACSNLMNLGNVAYNLKDYSKTLELAELQVKLLDMFNINSERTVYAYWQMALCAKETLNNELVLECLNQLHERLVNLADSPIANNHLFSDVKAPTQVVSAEALKASTKSSIEALMETKEGLTSDKDFSSLRRRLSAL